MTRTIAALALACALLWPAAAEARRRRCPAIPITIEGAGTVWICARPPRRR